MGSLVYYSFPMAGLDQSGDEWLSGKQLKGGLCGYRSSTLIKKSKDWWWLAGRGKDIWITREFLPLGLLMQKH